jgi:hypothetical protein
LRSALDKPNFNLDTQIDPFPLTQAELKRKADIQSFVAATIFAVALSFIPASLIVLFVKET